MKKSEDLWKYIEDENLSKETVEYLRNNNIVVSTIVTKGWNGKPYLCFNTYCKEWFMFVSNKESRRLKLLMRVAKKRIRLEIAKAKVKFIVRNYNHYVEETVWKDYI